MKKIVIACLALVSLAGCVPDCDHTLIADGVKPYIFKEGTYWVYSNSATGMNDTFTVVYSSTDNVTGSGPTKCKGERTWERNWITVVHQSDTVVLIASQDVHFFNETTGAQGSLFKPGLTNGACSDYKLCKVDDITLTIGANVFNNTHHFTTMLYDKWGAEKYSAEVFWVENIGMVKMAMQDSLSTTLNLQSWQVVQ